jgi:hypothetical protein
MYAGMREMSYHRPTISLFDIPILLVGIAIAAPFILALIAPFTHGL